MAVGLEGGSDIVNNHRSGIDHVPFDFPDEGKSK